MTQAPRHFEKNWFLHFGRSEGRPSAQIAETNGGVIANVTPPSPDYAKGYAEHLADQWIDNVRVMAAGQRMNSALRNLLDAAMKAGLPLAAPEVTEALDALHMATPPLHAVRYEDKVRFRGTHDECSEYIMKHQGNSIHHATKYEGWEIVPIEQVQSAEKARRETLATTFDISRVTPDDITHASRLDDIHEAALGLQNIAGIDSGDVAALCLDEDKWPLMSQQERRDALTIWIRSEPNYRDTPSP